MKRRTRKRTDRQSPPHASSVASHKLKMLHEMPSPSSDFDGTPTPRSRVARMTKRPDTTGAGKSASEQEARQLEWCMPNDEIHPTNRSGRHGVEIWLSAIALKAIIRTLHPRTKTRSVGTATAAASTAS